MPYTPPSQLSPAASKPTSPAPSRSQSWLQIQQPSPESALSDRPNLPRSTGSSSYLSKHRRSPSIQKQHDDVAALDFATGINGTANSEAFRVNGNVDPYGSLRQSPPPVNNMLIPTGATISPPDSSHNSSDEEETQAARRGRDGRQIENLEELHAAIRIIEQRKESSPNRNGDERKKVQMAGDLLIPQVSDRTSDDNTGSADSSRPPLSREARKISHSRSSTDSNIVFDNAHQTQSTVPIRQESSTDEEDESDESAGARRPAMVRKKSGELVRPALRPSSSKRRPSSMPGTPTYSKAVHFDSHLEHVRHFLQVDRPLAVSAGSSPVEAYESEAEFPFGSDENGRPRKHAYEWEIRIANFPAETEERKRLPVRVERIFLSADNKNLIGSIVCQNLAFQKLVVARFTLDYWKTTSEVLADYNNDVRKKSTDGCDRFSFSIKLADQANLENKTLFFCVKYETNGQQYWDNNNSVNYQVDFTKKVKAQPAKNNNNSGLGARPLSALPRSGRSPPATAGGRPKSMPVSFDDFANGFDNFGTFEQPSPSMLMGESPIKLKSPRSRQQIVPEAPVRRAKPNAQAFGNRYDFGASLSAAIKNASEILGEQSGLPTRPDTKQSFRDVPAVAAKGAVASAQHLENGVKVPSVRQVSSALAAGTVTSKPSALVSEKPSLQSQSYQELVDKYCFFGTAKASPQLTTGAIRSTDGANDDQSVSDFSGGSVRSDGSRTPTPPRSHSPSPPTEVSSVRDSPQISRSSSPLPRTGADFGSRAISPVSFGYPFYDNGNGILMETPPATAIHG